MQEAIDHLRAAADLLAAALAEQPENRRIIEAGDLAAEAVQLLAGPPADLPPK